MNSMWPWWKNKTKKDKRPTNKTLSPCSASKQCWFPLKSCLRSIYRVSISPRENTLRWMNYRTQHRLGAFCSSFVPGTWLLGKRQQAHLHMDKMCRCRFSSGFRVHSIVGPQSSKSLVLGPTFFIFILHQKHNNKHKVIKVILKWLQKSPNLVNGDLIKYLQTAREVLKSNREINNFTLKWIWVLKNSINMHNECGVVILESHTQMLWKNPNVINSDMINTYKLERYF